MMCCRATEYYEILNIKKPSSETEIRKAYRKLALIMHPDKNSAPQADDAFKRVSRAFQVLSDAERKRIYDQTGMDPDDRSSAAGPQARHMRAQPMDAEDIFNMFFGQGFGGPTMGPQFNFGPGGQFYFSSQNGPGIFSFGGVGPGMFGFERQQARAERARAAAAGDETPMSQTRRLLIQLIPFLILFLLPYITSVFDRSTSPAAKFSFVSRKPYVDERFTSRYNIPYYVNPKEAQKLSSRELRALDKHVETRFVSKTRQACHQERALQQDMMRSAEGWFTRDEELYQKALNMPTVNCDILESLGLSGALL